MIIYGRNVVKEALKAGTHLKRAYILNSNNLSQEMKQLENQIRHLGVTIEKVDEKKLEAISHSKDHQGIAAKIKDYRYADLENELKKIEKYDRDAFIIILDRIQDPHNFGAIIRSAYGAGVDLIVIPEKGGCPVTPAVLKTSAGYAFKMPICVEKNLSRSVQELKNRGIWVYAAVMDGTPYDDMDLKGPIALIFGNEGNGVRRLLVEKSDGKISIPMARKMDSLNVSVSVGIMVFRVMEARRHGDN
ncbi:23S rRNA (guanosine(2251)-2'-O)-methyltransferase RlmB [Mesoaciditoga sp.]